MIQCLDVRVFNPFGLQRQALVIQREAISVSALEEENQIRASHSPDFPSMRRKGFAFRIVYRDVVQDNRRDHDFHALS